MPVSTSGAPSWSGISALGAGRWSLVRQILNQGLVLCSAGYLLGLAVAWLGIRLLMWVAPADLPLTADVSLNPSVFLFSLVLTLLSWLMVSLFPALRLSGRRLLDSLQEGGRQAGPAAGQRWLRYAFVVAQVSLAIMLVIGVGLLTRSFWELSQVDPGLQTENVLSMDLELPASRYPVPKGWPWLRWPAVTQLQNNLMASIGSVPGVKSVALAVSNPLASGWTTRVAIVGQPERAADQQEEAYFLPVSEDYFRALGVPLARGRTFQPGDDDAHPLVAIVNQA